MNSASQSAAPEPNDVLIKAQQKQRAPLADVLKAISVETGGSYGFVYDFMRAAQRPGRVTIDEFVAMRLWDKQLYGNADIRQFLGFYGMRDVFMAANFDYVAHGLMQNKIAANAILAEYGLPTIPTAALHCATGKDGPRKSSTSAELASMLLEKLAYPIFCKPLDGLQSLGTISFDDCDPARRVLIRQDGAEIDADAFAHEVHAAYGRSGYLIQPRLVPAQPVVDICGHRTATVRVLSILDEGEVKIIRACWKIPAGGNSADNYWRDGNLLASVDVDTGVVGQPMTGKGFSYRTLDDHPDTGTRITGMTMPQWAEIKDLALSGNKVMTQFGLVGWDIAATEAGPVIVEMNETPDFTLPQMADRTGIYSPEFADFIKRRRTLAKQTNKSNHLDQRRDQASAFF